MNGAGKTDCGLLRLLAVLRAARLRWARWQRQGVRGRDACATRWRGRRFTTGTGYGQDHGLGHRSGTKSEIHDFVSYQGLGRGASA